MLIPYIHFQPQMEMLPKLLAGLNKKTEVRTWAVQCTKQTHPTGSQLQESAEPL